MSKTPENGIRIVSTIFRKNAGTIIPPPENSCCFTGHRPKYYHFGTDENHPDCIALKSRVREKCKYLITEKDVFHFISGGALGLDTRAMEKVLDLKKKYGHVTLECALPYAGMVERVAIHDQERYNQISSQLEAITALNREYHKRCMQQRNECMVDHSRYVVAVWAGEKSGTANTVNYAKKRGRDVYRLHPAP